MILCLMPTWFIVVRNTWPHGPSHILTSFNLWVDVLHAVSDLQKSVFANNYNTTMSFRSDFETIHSPRKVFQAEIFAITGSPKQAALKAVYHPSVQHQNLPKSVKLDFLSRQRHACKGNCFLYFLYNNSKKPVCSCLRSAKVVVKLDVRLSSSSIIVGKLCAGFVQPTLHKN